MIEVVNIPESILYLINNEFPILYIKNLFCRKVKILLLLLVVSECHWQLRQLELVIEQLEVIVGVLFMEN